MNPFSASDYNKSRMSNEYASIISLVPSSHNVPADEERKTPGLSIIKNPFVSMYANRIQLFDERPPEGKSRNPNINPATLSKKKKVVQTTGPRLTIPKTSSQLHTPDSGGILSARTPKLK